MTTRALTPPQFRSYLKKRKAEETLQSIAADLGVTREAVRLWIERKRKPSGSVLLAAAMHIQIEKRVKEK